MLLFGQIFRNDSSFIEGAHGFVVLRIIEVAVGRRAADDLVASSSGALDNISVITLPPVDDSGRRDTTFQNLIPADQPSSVGVEILLHLLGEPGLEFLKSSEVLLADSLLTERAVLPLDTANLVSPDFSIAVREKFEYFLEYILCKLDDLVASQTERVSPIVATTEPRVALGRHPIVSRHVDLRHDVDATDGSIFDNLPDVLLGIVPAVHHLAVDFAHVLLRQFHRRIPAVDRALLASLVDIFIRRIPPCSLAREKWIFLYFDSPCLGVDKMPVKLGKLIERHQVEQVLGLFNRVEVAHRIEHQASPFVGRLVLYLDSGNFPFDSSQEGLALYLIREKLAESGDSVDDSLVARRCDGDSVRTREKGIALIKIGGWGCQHKSDISFCPLLCLDSVACGRSKDFLEIACGRGERFV